MELLGEPNRLRDKATRGVQVLGILQNSVWGAKEFSLDNDVILGLRVEGGECFR